ncbi:PIR protein [Plasmodium yoelii]|uniref:PIR protein n=2 Tax=Plasmodium yoelii TaxID=5861 RepID=A0AAF0B5L5_PLAYO|nr:PIR protein [Plasmodium yoelii]WBY58966.1 PIR protein [Plasmodium yoelii yoelii]VTZ79798.1 PIR protein [Plasmodium yoelii]|eukprot:XP_022810902.1 PIR protein [Plasmodium yoelii]
MDDTLCGKLDLLREYLPDDLDKTTRLDFYGYDSFVNYCPGKNCNTEIDKITVGFLWLLGEYFTKYPPKSGVIDYNKPFFLYIILWLSYKLNQNTEKTFTTIDDFFTEYVNKSGKYEKFTNDAFKFGNLDEFIKKHKNLLNTDIKDLSKFYDASKLICNMYGNVAQNQTVNILSNNVNDFANQYTELNNKYNDKDTPHSKILSALSTDYNNIKEKRKNYQTLPEITEFSALASKSGVTSSSSSIGNKLFTVLSIFGAIAFFLGISYKYSLFGFRKRFQKQKLRGKLKNIKKRMKH